MVGYYVYHLFLCQHPPLLEVLKYMSEAIISRRGWGENGKPELRTEMIQTNQNWVVPNTISGNISVRIFGGGAGGCASNGWWGTLGGGGGWMNNGEFSIARGTTVQITIGKGGAGGVDDTGESGGTTAFGTYLSANGGSYRGDGGAGGGSKSTGGRGWQFGGGGGRPDTLWSETAWGGQGGTYGGGGGGGHGVDTNRDNYKHYEDQTRGGDGGLYGGGGGGGEGSYSPWSSSYWDAVSYGGTGGTYGGNGGQAGQNDPDYSNTYAANGNNGTNTIGNESVSEDCQGTGQRGVALSKYGGGGGGGGFG